MIKYRNQDPRSLHSQVAHEEWEQEISALAKAALRQERWQKRAKRVLHCPPMQEGIMQHV